MDQLLGSTPKACDTLLQYQSIEDQKNLPMASVLTSACHRHFLLSERDNETKKFYLCFRRIRKIPHSEMQPTASKLMVAGSGTTLMSGAVKVWPP